MPFCAADGTHAGLHNVKDGTRSTADKSHEECGNTEWKYSAGSSVVNHVPSLTVVVERERTVGGENTLKRSQSHQMRGERGMTAGSGTGLKDRLVPR
ncbi:hypothetical protein CDES_11745 [Corynebacterium deserti GIMN1.010]|uniref:Uncharacterized protein n=1 Tax=Corynebacterium deserti GIMN1.010 TaxID=931089 RepID=A0A0M3QA52_9CORY|nr:hypothetical protein CDES_11745 [Corynebacterium deserti GIMN1.010]